MPGAIGNCCVHVVKGETTIHATGNTRFRSSAGPMPDRSHMRGGSLHVGTTRPGGTSGAQRQDSGCLATWTRRSPQGTRKPSTRDKGKVKNSQYGKLAGLHPEDRPQGEAEHEAGQGGNIAASEY